MYESMVVNALFCFCYTGRRISVNRVALMREEELLKVVVYKGKC